MFRVALCYSKRVFVRPAGIEGKGSSREGFRFDGTGWHPNLALCGSIPPERGHGCHKVTAINNPKPLNPRP